MKVKKVTVEEKSVRVFFIPAHVDTSNVNSIEEVVQRARHITDQPELFLDDEKREEELKVEEQELEGIQIDRFREFYAHLKAGGG